MLVSLVQVETSSLRVELRGPTERPVLGNDGITILSSGFMGLASVGSGEEIVDCRVRSDTEELAVWEGTPSGPALFEQTTYRLSVETKDASGSPVGVSRDPGLLADLAPVPAHPTLSVGTLNFRGQVGRVDLTFLSPRGRGVRLTLEVFPTKLDYASDYQRILDDVSDVARALALEYLRATYSLGSTAPGDSPSRLEWTILLRNEITKLERAIQYVDAHPHRVIRRAPEYERVERIRRFGASTVKAITQRRGRGPWIQIPKAVPTRSWLPNAVAVESMDTPEHRWLRSNLVVAREHLAHIVEDLRRRIVRQAEAGYQTVRLQAELNEVSAMQASVSRLLASRVFEDAAGPPPPASVSLTLMQRAGYREAFTSLMALRLGLQVRGKAVELSTSELDRLYEIWCFVGVARVVASLLQVSPLPEGLFKRTERGLRVELKRGRESAIRFESGNRRITLRYNPAYPGPTGAQRPDIVIQITEARLPSIFVVLDAKYRIDTSGDYAATFGGPGPPIDAVNALHRFRDAITLETIEMGLGRPVVRGVALFPGRATAAEFSKHGLWNALGSLGIGAIPFLPDRSDILTEWLRKLLDQNYSELASPGPPFLAQSAVQKNQN